MRLTNKSGGAVALGDVVICDSTTASSFTTTTTGGLTTDSIGVALETIADNATGRVCTSGYVEQVNLDGAASLGDTINTDTVAKQATPHAAVAVGDFGQVLATGTSPAAWLWGGIGLPAAGAGDTFTQAQYVVMTADGDLTNERVLTAGKALTVTDGGAGSTATLDLNAIGARVYNDTSISVADSTNTAITYNTEVYDTDTIHDLGANTNRLTCKTAGYYIIAGSFIYAANATGNRRAFIYLNNTTLLCDDFDDDPKAADPCRLSLVTIYQLAVNDYVEILTWQSSGGALNITESGHTPGFGMQMIAEA
jgi:hypothetical protein